jgi:uncharacterized protein (DUF362 family)
MSLTRRSFFNYAAAAGATAGALSAQRERPRNPMEPWLDQPQPYRYQTSRSTVSLVKGESRRQNIHDALVAIDDQILPALKRKKYLILKPNCVSNRPLGTTNPEAMMGILDYLAPRYKGPVVIAESSSRTMTKFEELGFNKIAAEHTDRKIDLIDLNEEAKYEVLPVFDYHMRLIPVRLAARLLDPDAYIICCSVMKTHNAAMVTLSLKNMVLGAPLASPSGEKPRWSDKRKYHVGVRVMQGNMMLTAQKMKPFFGAAVIDGFEGMEGNGPHAGTPVDHRIAIASTDYLAADRVGVETMGIDPGWVGHLVYSHQAGLGQYDLDKIDLRGENVASVRKEYLLHSDADKQRQWMEPMEDLPARLG